MQLRKVVRLPSSFLRQKFGHNVTLDSGATSNFIKSDGGAKFTGQPSNKKVRIPNGQTLNTLFKARLCTFPHNTQPKSKAV